MNPTDFNTLPPPVLDICTDALVQIELRIARRADEISRGRTRGDKTADREYWRRAERDVLGRDFEQTSAA